MRLRRVIGGLGRSVIALVLLLSPVTFLELGCRVVFHRSFTAPMYAYIFMIGLGIYMAVYSYEWVVDGFTRDDVAR